MRSSWPNPLEVEHDALDEEVLPLANAVEQLRAKCAARLDDSAPPVTVVLPILRDAVLPPAHFASGCVIRLSHGVAVCTCGELPSRGMVDRESRGCATAAAAGPSVDAWPGDWRSASDLRPAVELHGWRERKGDSGLAETRDRHGPVCVQGSGARRARISADHHGDTRNAMRHPAIASTQADTALRRVRRILDFYATRSATDGVTVRLGDLREMMGNIDRASARRREAFGAAAPRRLRMVG